MRGARRRVSTRAFAGRPAACGRRLGASQAMSQAQDFSSAAAQPRSNLAGRSSAPQNQRVKLGQTKPRAAAKNQRMKLGQMKK